MGILSADIVILPFALRDGWCSAVYAYANALFGYVHVHILFQRYCWLLEAVAVGSLNKQILGRYIYMKSHIWYRRMRPQQNL